MRVPVGDALDNIGTKAINVVICMDCDGEASCEKSLRESFPTQTVDQWLNWFNNPSSGEEIPNIECIIALFLITKKNDGRLDPGIQ